MGWKPTNFLFISGVKACFWRSCIHVASVFTEESEEKSQTGYEAKHFRGDEKFTTDAAESG
eukprot:1353461-Amorphochlora_amoeboformis.AAC.1